MRSIHVIIPFDKSKLVEEVINSLKISYEKIEGKEKVLYIMSTPEEVVEIVIDALKKIGVGSLYGIYQVYNLEIASGVTEAPKKALSKRVSREEILYDIKAQAELNRNYLLSSILAAILATLGLLTDNIIITIASMIIAPFFGPILGTSLGIVLNIDDLRRESLKSEVIGLSLSILTGFLLSLSLPHTKPTSQILFLTHPTYVSIIFAVVAGVAAAISVVSVASMALVGVAIAASIVPPAVNIGIGVAFMIKNVEEATAIIFGSTLILVINVLAINTMSILFFWFSGVRPSESIRKEMLARKTVRRRFIALTIVFLLAVTPIAYMTAINFQETKVEDMIKKDIREYFKLKYPNIEILEIDVRYSLNTKIAYVYITIATQKINESLTNIATGLKNYLIQKYSINFKIYLDAKIVT